VKYLVLARGLHDDLPVRLCETEKEAMVFAASGPLRRETMHVGRVLGLPRGIGIEFWSVVEFDDDGKPVRKIAV